MKRILVAAGLIVLGIAPACKKDSTTGPSGNLSCEAGDPVCPPVTALGFSGPAGSPSITPTNASTAISTAATAFTVSGATNATGGGYWFIAVGTELRAWGQLDVSSGSFNADVPLFCGPQKVLASFANGSGRSYWTKSVTLTGCITAGFRVQLTWDTGPSSDIDLHLVRPGGSVESSNDCYYGNCTFFGLDWGASGPAGDPVLDVDNTDGFGPENITIVSGAETGQYTVVIHNYNGVVSTRATVKIYFNDVEQQRFTSSVLTPGTNNYWQVAKVNILTSQITNVNTYSQNAPFAAAGAAARPPNRKR